MDIVMNESSTLGGLGKIVEIHKTGMVKRSTIEENV